MHSVSFTYKGKNYSGHIASNTEMQPHLHWLLLTDPELIKEFGDDSVAFYEEKDHLINCNRVPVACRELVSIAHLLIEEHLKHS
jgi:hypothetical protein